MIDQSVFHNKKVVFHTLGCKLNFAETSAIGKHMSDVGFVKARAGESADVCVINTCSVTDTADRKCRQAIGKMHRKHPNAIMVVTGCYAQLKPDEIAKIDGVDLVLGANEKFDILEYLEKLDRSKQGEVHHSATKALKQFRPSCSKDDRTRYFLKVQDGCDYFCTYCTIPMARGRSRNATIAETVDMAKDAVNQGAKEIVLTGVNIGDFGKSTGERFFDLVKALDAIEADVRFRISSIEPNLLTDEFIEFVAQSERFMPHFHIPLQSGTNEVLKIMKRKYDRELFAHKVETIKRIMPDAFIGVDVIVGVRGETDELFEASCHFIDSLNVSQLHVFTYSERAGTKMLDVEQVTPPAIRKKRSDILHLLSDKKLQTFYESQRGRTLPVLWESRLHGDMMYGFTNNYVRLTKPKASELINSVELVKLGNWDEERGALLAE